MVQTVTQRIKSPGSFIECVVDLPASDPSNLYTIDVLTQTLGEEKQIRRMTLTNFPGDHKPLIRPSAPNDPISFGFSYDGDPSKEVDVIYVITQNKSQPVLITGK